MWADRGTFVGHQGSPVGLVSPEHTARLPCASSPRPSDSHAQPITGPSSPPAPGTHRVEFDWRGETAYYVEHDRRVWLACMYWGGPKGSVSHIHGVREYGDGRREYLTPEERAAILQVVIDTAKTREGIALEIEK
jgi:hypothetical protein